MKKSKGIIKIAAFAAVIIGALFVIQWYQLKCLARLQETVYAVNNTQVAQNLTREEQPEEVSVHLLEVKESEAVYRRGNDLYVGQSRERIDGDFPFYVNNGNAVMVMNDNSVLINAGFDEIDVFQGMYISDGFSFNYDKSQADEDSFLFLKLSNGLFLNAQPIQFNYPGGESQVRMNSIFYLGPDGARYYAVSKDYVLQYGEIPTVKMTTVTIGGQTYSYEELLMYLGITGDGMTKPPKAEEGDSIEDAVPLPDVPNQGERGDQEPENAPMSSEEGAAEDSGTEEGTDSADQESAGEGVREEKKNEKDPEAAKPADGDRTQSDSKNSPAGGNSTGNAGSNGGNGSGSAGSGSSDMGSGGAGGGSSDTGGGSTGSGNDGQESGGENTGSGDAGDNGDASEGGSTGSGGQGDTGSGSSGQGSGSGSTGSGSGNAGSGSGGQGSGSGNAGSGSGGQGSGSGSTGSGSGNAGSGSGGQGSGSGNAGSGSGSQGSGSGNAGSGSGDQGSGSGNAGSGSGNQGSGSGNAGSGSGSTGSGNGSQGSGSGDTGSGDDNTGSGDAGDSGDAGGSGGGSISDSDGEDTDKDADGSADPGEIPFIRPTAELEKFIPDVYSITSHLEIKDLSGKVKRVVIELYWQPAGEDGTPAEDSSDPKDYKAMYRKTFRSSGDITIDNLPPGTTMYAKGRIYYTENGETKNYEFYDGFEDRVTTWGLDSVDDLYLEFSPTPNGGDMTTEMLPYQMQIWNLAISGPNPNVLGKISKIRILASEQGGDGEELSFQMNLSDAKRNYFYAEDEMKRPVWVSDMSQISLNPDTAYDYTIELLDTFGNRFTHVVEGYCEKAEGIDWEENKSLNCCEKNSDQYYMPKGTTWTARLIPRVVLSQRKFDDGEKNINRAKYEIEIRDENNASAGYEGEYYLRVYKEGPDGPEQVEFETPVPGETDRQVVRELQLTEDNVKNGKQVYEIWGLTAGHIYEVRIYGSYDINNRMGKYTDKIIGSQRFSTVAMASYGRVSYDFASSHVKTRLWPDGMTRTDEKGELLLSPYESATAQRVSMSINFTQTNKSLVDLYMNYADIEVRESAKDGKSVLKASLQRDMMETYKIRGTGTGAKKEFELPLDQIATDITSGLNGYLPKVYLEANDFLPDTEVSAWDLFAAGGKLVFYWEDGHFAPITGYQISTATYAMQGGELHDVTTRVAAFRQMQFSTLKRMPYVTYDDILVVSDYVKIYGMRFHDPDHAIEGGVVEKTLAGSRTDSVVLDYEIDPGGALKKPIEYNNLMKNSQYQIYVSAPVIRRDTAGSYTLRGERLISYSLVAGEGLEGSLVFEGITYPLAPKVGVDADQIRLRSEYSLYNASGYKTGKFDNTTGVVADTRVNSQWDWNTSPYIPVTPGSVYYLQGLRENDTATSTIQFYEDGVNPNSREEKKVARIDTAAWKRVETGGSTAFTVFPNSAIVIPEGVSYMRFAMYGHVDGIPTYATASCFDLTKAEAAEQLTKSVSVGQEGESNGILVYKAVPGERYTFMRTNVNYTISYLDASGAEISGSAHTPTGYYGYHEEAPSGAAYVKVVCGSSNANTKKTFYQNFRVYHLMEEKLEWLNSRDISRFANSLTVEVKDKNNNLIQGDDNKVYLDIYQKIDQKDVLLSGDDSPLPEEVREALVLEKSADGTATFDLSRLVSFVGDSNQEFKLELYVYYHGEKIVLDQVNFETNRVLEVIHDRTELAKLMRYPYGDFLVVRDIELRENELFYFGDSRVPFQGTLDFQGHTLRVRCNQSYYGMHTIGNGAVVKNFVLDYTIDSYSKRANVDWCRGLAVNNYGTVRDFILKLNLGQGMYRKNYSSGLCERNYGLIENFALEYQALSSNYVGAYFGGICYENTGGGILRNGYAYCPGVLSVTTGIFGGTGGSGAVTNAGVGLLAYANSGKIENVYVAGGLAVEDYAANGSLGSHGLICGSGSNVSNSFTIGELYKVVWAEEGGRQIRQARQYTTYGPALPGNPGASARNNFYYTNFSVPYQKNLQGRQEQISNAAVFQDPTFYDRTVNQGGAFQVDDITSGRLPRVIMERQDMMLMQPRVPLTVVTGDSQVQFAYGILDGEVQEGQVNPDGTMAQADYALATLVFRNRLERTINSIQVSGLKVEPREGTEFKQYSQDGLYKVEVKLTPDGTLYSDRYNVTRFTYGDRYTAEVKGQQLYVTFSRPVTQANWCEVFTDRSGFYRLAEDIDYNAFPDDQREKAASVLATGDFQGSLDGRNRTLKNFVLNKYSNLIGNLSGGKLFDLRVEGMTINAAATSNNDYRGLVGQCQNNATIERIVLKDIEIQGIRHYAGALAGLVKGSRVSDCVGVNVVMETAESAVTLRVGGLVGRLETTRLENCFVKGLKLTAQKGGGVTGIGGLVGDAPSGTFVEKAYVQGTMDSAFANTGGLVGNLNGVVSSAWSKVNINSAATYVGGAAGLLDSSGQVSRLLTVGEVFTSASDKYGRIVGGYLGNARKYMRCYAAAEQKINSQVLADRMDAEGLMTEEELRKEFYYWDMPNMGDAFDYDVVEAGFLPLLYCKDGSALLPEQEDKVSVSTKGVSFTAEGDAKLNESTAGSGVGSVTVADYDLTVTLSFDDERLATETAFNANAASILGADYGKLSIENMEFGKDADGKIQVTRSFGTTSEGKPCCKLAFAGLHPQKYVDSYRVVLETGEGPVGTKLVFRTKVNGIETETPLYRHIYRAQDAEAALKDYTVEGGTVGADANSWQGAMRLAGYGYENFLIMKDLDFTGVQSEELLTRLKINRLEGNVNRISLENVPGDYPEKTIRDDYLMAAPGADFNSVSTQYAKLQNLTYQQDMDSEVCWIFDVRTSMCYLHFKNIKWTDGKKGTAYLGVIGRLTGAVSYVDIEKFTLDYGYATDYVGFIAHAAGSVEYVRGRDIVLKSGKGDAGRLNYIGGIVGYARETLQHVGIKGTKTTTEGKDAYTYSINGSGVATSGSYTGGIVGYLGKGGIFLYADTVEATGSYRVGCLAGTYTGGNAQTNYSEAMYNQTGVHLTEAANGRAAGLIYVGGSYGTIGDVRWCLSRDNNVYAQKTYAGGFSGSGSGYYNTALGCVVRADEAYAGGICGSSGYPGRAEVGGCTISAPQYAGGFSGGGVGETTMYDGCYVHDCAVYGDSDIGGVSGLIENTGLQGAYVKDCIIGRQSGKHPEVTKGADDTYSIIWVADSDGIAQRAGGIAGTMRGASLRNSVVDGVDIYAYEAGGGAVGSGSGGDCYNLEIDADIHVNGRYAGGYAGELTSYIGRKTNGTTMRYPVAKLKTSIFTGTICETERNAQGVGGLVGIFRPGERMKDPENGDVLQDGETGYRHYMDKDNFNRIVLAQTALYGEANNAGITVGHTERTNEAVPAGKEGVAYLRVYGSMIYLSDGALVKNVGNIEAPGPWSYQESGLAKAEDAFYVTTADLKDRYFYYGDLEKGGLFLAERGDWINSKGVLVPSYFRNFLYTVEAETRGIFPYVAASPTTTSRAPSSRDKAGVNADQPDIQTGIPIPEDSGATTFAMLRLDDVWEQVSIYASGVDTVNLEFPQEFVTALEEVSGDQASLHAGGAGTDGLGTPGRDTGTAGTMGTVDPAIPRFRIYDSNGALLTEDVITRRVYTIPYDYQTTLTVKVTAGNDSRSYVLTGESLCHTVMTDGGHCYYLKADGVYRESGPAVAGSGGAEAGNAGNGETGAAGKSGIDAGTGNVGNSGTGNTGNRNTDRVLDGDFLHLYRGKVLDRDGQIFEVESGRKVADLDRDMLFVPATWETPAYETVFDGQKINTYRLFSITEGEESGSDYRLFAKNGKLFGMDPELDQPYGQSFQSFLADYYSTSQGSTEYLSILTENMVLKDYKTPVSWPVDKNGRKILDNFQICEVGDNLNAEQPYVILRYQDNTVAAFNYLTGTLLFVDDSEKKDMEFTEYANLWLKGKKESLNAGNAYKNAAGLVGKLVSNPIDDSLVMDCVKDPNVTGGTAGAGSDVLDIATDGTNRTEGKNENTGGNQEGTDAGEADGSSTEAEAENAGNADGGKAETGNGTESAGNANGSKVEAEGGRGTENGGSETGDEGGSFAENAGGTEESEGGAGVENGGSGTENSGSDSGNRSEAETESSEGADGSSMEAGAKTSGNGDSAETGAEASGRGSVGAETGAEASGSGSGTETGVEASGSGSVGAEASGSGSVRAETGVEASGSGSVGAETGAEASGSGSVRAETGVEASGSGSVRAETGAEASGSGSVGAETGVEASGSESRIEGGEAFKAGREEGTDTANAGNGTEAGRETSGSGKASGTAYPPADSDRTYVTMITARSEGYEVFRASELLTAKGSAMLSENQKLKILEENGVTQSAIDLENLKLTAEENRTGLIMVSTAAALILVLVGVLYWKKRKMDKE